MALSISPRIDLVFKKIFGVEENKDLLMSLINSIVSEEDQVAEVTLLNPYNVKNFFNEKASILDVKARGVDGVYFNIEIQITDEGDYNKRALYYWAKLYTEQLKVGDGYKNLCKVVGIHILNFFSIPQSQSYINKFHITEAETGIQYFNDLELYTVELKKFEGLESKALSELIPKIKTGLDMWVAFLTRHELFNRENLPSVPHKIELNKALNVLEVMNFTLDERDAYEGRVKWFRAEAAALSVAEKKGRQEGKQEGRQEGRQEGIEQVAKNLLLAGLDIQMIAKNTGLTIEEIQALK